MTKPPGPAPTTKPSRSLWWTTDSTSTGQSPRLWGLYSLFMPDYNFLIPPELYFLHPLLDFIGGKKRSSKNQRIVMVKRWRWWLGWWWWWQSAAFSPSLAVTPSGLETPWPLTTDPWHQNPGPWHHSPDHWHQSPDPLHQSSEQAPLGSRDKSQDPAIFWIQIPISENYF